MDSRDARVVRDGASGTMSALFARWCVGAPLVCALIGCRPDAEAGHRDPWVWRDLPPPIDQTIGSAAKLRVSLKGVFGADTGNAVLGRISAVAANANELFVFDRTTCEVVVFTRQTRSVARRFGRCGKGPDDLEYVTAMALVNDTLVLMDRGGEALSLWSANGSPLSTRAIALRDSNSVRALSAAPVGSGTVGVAAELLSNRASRDGRVYRAQGAAHVRFVDYSGVEVRAGLFVDGEGPERRTQGLYRSLASCADVDEEGVPYVAAFNDWVPQLAIVSLTPPRGSVRLNTRFADLPLHPVRESEGNDAFLPGGLTRVACHREMVVGSAILDSSRTTGQRVAIWIAIDVRGMKPFVARAAKSDAEWFGAVNAIHGRTAFVIQNTVAGYPRVAEVEMAMGEQDAFSMRR
jgi:hypothetical protein